VDGRRTTIMFSLKLIFAQTFREIIYSWRDKMLRKKFSAAGSLNEAGGLCVAMEICEDLEAITLTKYLLGSYKKFLE